MVRNIAMLFIMHEFNKIFNRYISNDNYTFNTNHLVYDIYYNKYLCSDNNLFIRFIQHSKFSIVQITNNSLKYNNKLNRYVYE